MPTFPRAEAERGFTLVELLVVLAVVAAAAAIAVPNFLGAKAGANLASGEQELRVALRGARSLAIAANRVVRVTVSPDGRAYAVDGERRAFRAGGELRAELLAFGAQHPPAIAFFPSGGASGGRILLRHGAERRSFAIDPATGEVVADAR